MNKIVYVDMDNVLVNFQSGLDKISNELRMKYINDPDEIPGVFSLMDPIEDAISYYQFLAKHFDTYILSTSPWENPTALNDKLDWVKKYLGKVAYKRLILSHHKHLNKGDYLIDDRPNHNGVDRFEGKLIHFTSDLYPNWKTVIDYFSKYVKY